MKKQLIFFLFINTITFAQFNNTQLERVNIQSYTFYIQINDNNNQIQAKTIVSFKALKKINQIVLNLKNKNNKNKGMEVKRVEWTDKTPLQFNHTNDSLYIYFPAKLKKNQLYQLQIYYTGIPADGLYIKKNKYGKRTFFGDNWPNRAQNWLPVIDHPSDKAKVEWFITTPKHYEVIASGRLIQKLNLSENDVYHFKTDVSLPTKVMVMAAADFQIKYFLNLKLPHQCVPISGWIYADETTEAFDDFTPSIDILKYYNHILGPYPYQKLANVQSNTRFGGMENAGNIFYDENKVNGLHQIENLIAHEIAHQWFGNNVTEQNWRDIWLSEGFATYLNSLYIEHKYGKKKLQERMAKERSKIIRFNRYKTLPIVYEENENLFNLLNPNSYEKGAWVLHMLRQKTGDKTFFQILKTFYLTYRNNNASTEDFIKVSEKVSGKSLQTFFDQWLFRSGVPLLTISSNYSNDKKQITIYIKQIRDTYQLELPVLIKSGEKEVLKKLFINKKEQSFAIKLSTKEKLAPEIVIDPYVQVLFEKTE